MSKLPLRHEWRFGPVFLLWTEGKATATLQTPNSALDVTPAQLDELIADIQALLAKMRG